MIIQMYILDNLNFYNVNEKGSALIISSDWKILDSEEILLGKQADSSLEGRKKYVNYYKSKNINYYEVGLKLIDKTIKEFVHKKTTDYEYENLVEDMIYSLHRFGCTFEEYFILGFEDLSTKARKSFITDKIRFYLYNKINLESNRMTFDDKYQTYLKFNKYYKRKSFKLNEMTCFEDFASFVSDLDKFIVKPYNGAMGRGVKIYNKTDFDNLMILFETVKTNGETVIEELIIQDDRMSVMHPSSVNTVRMPVIKKNNGDIVIFHPFFRMGQGSSIVDNAGAGGIFANVDAETGIVYTEGIDERGHHYIVHPDTKKQIVGFNIPSWNELVDLTKKVSLETSNRYIGWDFALTQNGWVLVEGNPEGQFVMQYVNSKGLLEEILELIK